VIDSEHVGNCWNLDVVNYSSSALMKILQLIPKSIFPPDDGGRIGIMNISKHLLDFGAVIHAVVLEETPTANSLIRSFIQSKAFHYQSLKHSTANTPNRILRSLLSSNPIYLSKHYSDNVLNQIIEFYHPNDGNSNGIDVIHADHTAMMPLALAIRQKWMEKYGTKIPIGLRLHNIEARIWERYANELPKFNPKKWYIARQAVLLREREWQFVQQTDVVFPISETDNQEVQQQCPHINSIIVKAGINPNEWKQGTPDGKISGSMVIASVWSWIHNTNGLLWFINEVMPLIESINQSANLTVLGKNPPESLTRINRNSINIKGYVESVKPYFEQSLVYVAPLFVGGGMRVKIIEAMAAGLPVVATAISAEGLSANEQDGLFVTDNPNRMAELISDLLNNPTKAMELGKKAQEYVVRNHSWEYEVQRIYKAYQELTPNTKS
jgi:polysaccharide biosynthesis protein PslH